ncbi:MAG: DUF2232 domain-containing protein [Bdellovibrionaceae bacterium]|nr:DUF2232 domain-containing protein [Pseudobdellovibrionaceae bacterium]MBX3033682.1 DUF2232 domain-containing protein [Pseudobdellovibrionaceae bacterium]
MKKKATFPQLLIHTAFAVLLTMLTGFLGAPFLRVIRQSQGAWRYWLTGLVVVTAFWVLGTPALSVLLLSLWMTLGVYSELEGHGWGWRTSGFVSLFAGTMAGAAGFTAVLVRAGVTNWDGFVGLVSELTATVQKFNPEVKPDPTMLAQQAPSVLVIMLILALGIGLIFERKLFVWSGLPRERVASHLKLLEFRLPDFYVWIALAGFFLTVVNFGSNALAALGLNIVNVSIVLYFFQGLAVLEVLLNSLKAGIFVRILTYVFLVGQLFFVISAAGFIDYWADFRRRLSNSGMAAEKS